MLGNWRISVVERSENLSVVISVKHPSTQHTVIISLQFFMPRRSTLPKVWFLLTIIFGWCHIRLPYGYIGRYFCLHIIVRIMISRKFMVSSTKLNYSVVSQYTSTVAIGSALKFGADCWAPLFWYSFRECLALNGIVKSWNKIVITMN
jgi:hypothetical protein